MTAPVIIAIVEDDAIVRSSIDSLVRAFGYETSLFACAEAFLQADPTRFDSVISDVNMPGMSGLELQRHLRILAPALPILFVTAFPNARTRDQAIAAGAAIFLEKPFEPDDLLAALRAALTG